MNRSFDYLKCNNDIVNELKKLGKIGKCLKHSANACFYVSKMNPNSVIKVFNCHSQNYDIINERKNNFINEIEILKCLNKTIQYGITQVKNSGSFEISNCFCVYYEMPKYEVYNNNKNVISILNDFKYLYWVLKQIHDLGYIHFDIKRNNIMFYMNKPVLIDFGCAKKKSGKIELPKGPKWFKPPELLNRLTSDDNLQYDIDYEKSDIYMMSKTLWAVLQNGIYENGFYGEYNRNYLEDIKKRINLNCEPLNLLFENTIIKDWSQRLSIEECIRLLENQIKILENEYSESCIKNDCYVNYDLLEILHSVKPSKLVYTDSITIEKIIKEIKRIIILRISDEVKILDSNISQFSKELLKPVAENHYIIEYKDKKINIVINSINVYKLDQNQVRCELILDDIDDFNDRFTFFPQFSYIESEEISGTYYLDSSHIIIVELDSNDEKLSISSLFKL